MLPDEADWTAHDYYHDAICDTRAILRMCFVAFAWAIASTPFDGHACSENVDYIMSGVSVSSCPSGSFMIEAPVRLRQTFAIPFVEEELAGPPGT